VTRTGVRCNSPQCLTLPSSGRLPACFARFQPPLMSNVRRLAANMSRPSKLVLFYGAVLLLLCDAHALLSRLELAAPPPLSWPRVTTSLFTQAVVLLLAWAYLRLIAQKPRLELPPFSSFDSWRVRYTPNRGAGSHCFLRRGHAVQRPHMLRQAVSQSSSRRAVPLKGFAAYHAKHEQRGA
jgi:hypothetical protein